MWGMPRGPRSARVPPQGAKRGGGGAGDSFVGRNEFVAPQAAPGQATGGGTVRKVLLLMGLSMLGAMLFSSVALAQQTSASPSASASASPSASASAGSAAVSI